MELPEQFFIASFIGKQNFKDRSFQNQYAHIPKQNLRKFIKIGDQYFLTLN